MNPSGMIREVSVLYSIGAIAAELKPSTGFIWKNIETGKQILDFIGEIPEWANYEKNLDDSLESLKGKKERLCCMKEDLMEEVNNIEFQTNKKRKRQVDNWERNVRAKADDVDSQESEMQRKNRVFRFIFRAWLGKCVKNEEEEIDELIKEGEALASGSGLVLDHTSNDVIQYHLVASALVGKASFEKRLEIWTMLIRPKVRILGIVGEPGIGKTTMMANIYNLEVVHSGSFQRAFYVSVKEEFDLYRLQAAIGEAMNLRDLINIKDTSFRASRIQSALWSCGKFLLILDGLSKDFRLTEVGIPIENGGKLVVVSRSHSVCRRACEKVIRVEKMPEEDSSELFWKTLNSSAELSPEIEDLALEIVRQCEGVPLKIVDTAISLRSVDAIFEWREKLRELETLHSNNTENNTLVH